MSHWLSVFNRVVDDLLNFTKYLVKSFPATNNMLIEAIETF